MNVGKLEKLQYLNLGIEGSNDQVSVVIDVSGWVDELVERGYENPCFHILFKPYNQEVPITCDAVTEFDRDEKTLTWTITQSVTQYPGLGYTEIRALNHPDNGLLAKSKAIPTMIDNSITGASGGTIPAPYDDWVNSILALIDDLNNALDGATPYYAFSDSPTEAPDPSDYTRSFPDISQHKGEYLWTRTDIHWATGSTSSLYTVSYIPYDGEGAVDSVNGQAGPVTLDGRNLYRILTDDPSTRVPLNDAIDSKMDKTNIVYTTGSQPSNPVTGMIWLKKKT